MRRFFYNQPNVLTVGESIPLTEDIFHHWCKVLRANIGDTALFFDGTGGEYTVTLSEISKKSALVKVESFDPIDRALPYEVHIGLVMSRGERMDYAIQKATEMGVTTIQLLTSERCEVRLKPDQISKKLEHWQGVAISACEQCGLNLVPKILPPIELGSFILSDSQQFARMSSKQEPTNNDCLKLVLAVPKQQSHIAQNIVSIKSHLASEPIRPIVLLIGSEGGLADHEVTQAMDAGYLAWQIGERVLRTETAPVVALATLQAFLV
ncbi:MULTISPECIES: 16S rRNA (uracil(1498)-N(3))-methyltransferase [unclassified Moraxella]|uniref:16S rRNA (uracil(1498)-N(3))-methyltransferase n=1 Tax=unclassified Moraxella TaxID=2685852 RepID=UPI003AF9F199